MENKMLKHVVFLKFKEGVTEKDIDDLDRSFSALPSCIPEIKVYEFGRDIIRSERSYDYVLVSAFENLETMNRYQVHPEHQALLQKVRRLSDSILAVDFYA
jgi:hypothetical protein